MGPELNVLLPFDGFFESCELILILICMKLLNIIIVILFHKTHNIMWLILSACS